MEDKDKILADSKVLASDISMLFVQASNDKGRLFHDIIMRSPALKDDYFYFIESFYLLFDRTSHHLSEKVQNDYGEFFEKCYVWETDADDEEDFLDEVAMKSKEAMRMFDSYKLLLNKRGILDLVHKVEAEVM